MQNKKMILIVGKSGSGKDYLAAAFGLRMVISHTTRPPRKGDVNGVTKHFHMTGNINTSTVVAFTVFDGHSYWATVKDLLNKDAYIIDMAGIKFMSERYGKYFDDTFSIVYVSCAWYKRLYRLIKRDGVKRGIKRFKHDIGKFKSIKNYDHTEIRN